MASHTISEQRSEFPNDLGCDPALTRCELALQRRYVSCDCRDPLAMVGQALREISVARGGKPLLDQLIETIEGTFAVRPCGANERKLFAPPLVGLITLLEKSR